VCVLANESRFPINRGQKFVSRVSFSILMSRYGSVLSVSFSMVNFNEGCAQRIDFVVKHLTVVQHFENSGGIINLIHAGLGSGVEKQGFVVSTKMLTSIGPSGLPKVMASVCLYMVLLKLNSIESVAVFISSIEMF